MKPERESQPSVLESMSVDSAAPAEQANICTPITDQIQSPPALQGQEALVSSLPEAKEVPSLHGSLAPKRRKTTAAREVGQHIQASSRVKMGQERRNSSVPLVEAPPSPKVPTRRRMQLEIPGDTTGALEQRIIPSLEGAPIPATQSVRRPFLRRSERPARQPWFHDRWLVATILVACIASIASCWYYFQQGQLLLYSDAISHLRIAREIVDSITPGLAQLGGVWLPLPHLLMFPFIWNDYLWRSGLAGSIPSMASYLVAATYLFRSARRLTGDSGASFVGTLLFILNPNILYLQSTPMSESLCIATTVIACYYFLAWTQDDHPKYLVGMAAGTFLATLTRYDGWGLFLMLLALLVIVGIIKKQPWVQIEGTLLVYGSLGSFGIVLWFLWCGLIFGDPFYFHHYLFGNDGSGTAFYTYLNPWQSIGAYLFLSIQTVGPLLFALAGIALVIFVFRMRLTPSLLGGVAFLTPFVFYMLIFLTGQDTVDVPGFSPPNAPFDLWNVRFGVESVAPIALFFALLAKRWSIPKLAPLWDFLRRPVLILVIGIQTALIASGGILSLQDGVYGASCEPPQPITVYLAQHYAGGKILEDANDYRISEADIGIDLKSVIYEGSGELWTKALNDPASVVEWIIVPSIINNDPIASHIDLESATFLSQFTLVLQQGSADPVGLRLYHLNGGPPLPTRPIPADLLTEHSLCPGRSPGPHTRLQGRPLSGVPADRQYFTES